MQCRRVEMFQSPNWIHNGRGLSLSTAGVIILIPGFIKDNYYVENSEMHAYAYEELLDLLEKHSLEDVLKQETNHLAFKKTPSGLVSVKQNLPGRSPRYHMFSESKLAYMKENSEAFRTLAIHSNQGIKLPEDKNSPQQFLKVEFYSNISVVVSGRGLQTYQQSEYYHNIILSHLCEEHYFQGVLNVAGIRFERMRLEESGRIAIKIPAKEWNDFRKKCSDGSYNVEKMIKDYICKNKS